jgi:hypothetical protein
MLGLRPDVANLQSKQIGFYYSLEKVIDTNNTKNTSTLSLRPFKNLRNEQNKTKNTKYRKTIKRLTELNALLKVLAICDESKEKQVIKLTSSFCVKILLRSQMHSSNNLCLLDVKCCANFHLKLFSDKKRNKLEFRPILL